MAHIPLVDFKLLGLGSDRPDPENVDDVALEGLVAEVKSALTSSGFLYLRNHGIDKKTITDAFTSARQFFDLPEALKQRCKYNIESYDGWVPLGSEKVNPNANRDIMERLTLFYQQQGWALDEVPSLIADMSALYHKCHILTLRVLSVISLAVGKERNFFGKFHRQIGKQGNSTVISAVYYPPITEDLKGQTRLGAHTDFGTLTLLFQDDVGGLEVWSERDEQFEPAVPIPDAIIVNIGDALQRWTADQLVSNKHRVVIPTTQDSRKRVRQSIAFFADADSDVMLESVDGSNKYPAVSMKDYLDSRLKATFSY